MQLDEIKNRKNLRIRRKALNIVFFIFYDIHSR